MNVRPHPAGLQALYLPNFETKEPRQQQRHQWFNGEGDLTRLKQGTHPTVCDRQWAGHGYQNLEEPLWINIPKT